MRRLFNGLINAFGVSVVSANVAQFHSDSYLRHDARRLEHLASLRLPVTHATVLEVGAGVGDHSHYYIDRGCKLTITDARRENLASLMRRYPDQEIAYLDLEDPEPLPGAPFNIVHCYGLLYHLRTPDHALDYLAGCCTRLLLLETQVSFGTDERVPLVDENAKNPTQSCSGAGCRPTRPWLFKKLKSLFEHVYIPRTQPHHEDFPLDWTAPDQHQGLVRAIFIASRTPLDNEVLSTELLEHQTRHE
jgi:hypothetical protein